MSNIFSRRLHDFGGFERGRSGNDGDVPSKDFFSWREGSEGLLCRQSSDDGMALIIPALERFENRRSGVAERAESRGDENEPIRCARRPSLLGVTLRFGGNVSCRDDDRDLHIARSAW